MIDIQAQVLLNIKLNSYGKNDVLGWILSNRRRF